MPRFRRLNSKTYNSHSRLIASQAVQLWESTVLLIHQRENHLVKVGILEREAADSNRYFSMPHQQRNTEIRRREALMRELKVLDEKLYASIWKHKKLGDVVTVGGFVWEEAVDC